MLHGDLWLWDRAPWTRTGWMYIRLTATWDIGRYTRLYATASRFFTGTFLRSTGPSPNVDFLQAEVALRF